MKRKLTLCAITILFLFTLVIMLFNYNNSFKDNNEIYALTVDGINQNSFPSKGLYKVTVNCSNANSRWDYDEWKLYIDNLSDNVSCDVAFETISKEYFNNYIVSLLGTVQGSGQIVNEYGYRYEGKNPNNYVLFNNELWRIIGVFDSTIHGVENAKLVKIMRNEPIGAFSLHNYFNYGHWDNYQLRTVLDYYYRNKMDGTNNNFCYGNRFLTKNCDFSDIGINDIYRKMITNSLFPVGGGYEFRNVIELYSQEFVNSSKSVSGYIGLISLTDYGFSSLSTDCPRSSQFNSASCASTSWINGFYEWTLTNWNTSQLSGGWNYYLIPGSYMYTSGNLSLNIRPTLYLNESVYVLDGDGSITDPYIIAMDEA